jgi:phosphoenolpyruvate-protein phosphotransferase (PTS system enzyme I)
MPPDLLIGLSAAPGVGVGSVRRLAPALTSLPELAPADDPGRESEAARTALAEVASDLRARGGSSTAVAGEVLDALAQLVEDPALDAEVQRRTEAGEPAAAATWAAFEAFADQLTQLGGAFAERAADLIDLRGRVAARLLGLDGGSASPSESGEPVVLTCDDLSPADAATLDVDSTAAIVTRRGGPTSHTAIVARSLGIPAVVGCTGALEIDEGVRVLVDGDQGQVLVSPSDEQVEAALDSVRDRATQAAAASGPGRTADGHPVALMVNAGGPADVADLDEGCAGVGLLRTELLFLNRSTAPGVDEQRRLYRAVLERLEGRAAVVRTLDAGADKPLPFATQDDEPNPALGVRGFRLDRVQPEVLDDQLEAISLAADGLDVELRVMAPMVATLTEAAAFVERARAHGIRRAGVMVEVPALALVAEDLVEIVDFVCLGTNDLSQYSLAADRTLGSLGDLLDPWQPGLLRLAAPILAAARRRDIPSSVCGEAASNEQLACVLVGLGATSLSMSPAALPAVRAALREHTLAACEAAAQAALAAGSAEEARPRAVQTLGQRASPSPAGVP